MSENEENKRSSLDVRDVVLLKHALNESITYKGYNAAEVRELKKISREEWAEVRHKYKEWKKHAMLFSNWWILAFIVLGGLLILIGTWAKYSWITVVGGFLGFFAGIEGFKRIGHDEGYIYGYEHGFEAGINRALEIDDEEDEEVRKRSVEMKMDEKLIEGLTKKPKE